MTDLSVIGQNESICWKVVARFAYLEDLPKKIFVFKENLWNMSQSNRTDTRAASIEEVATSDSTTPTTEETVTSVSVD